MNIHTKKNKHMKEFIKGIFTNGDPVSSKRVFGAIGFIAYIVLFYFDKPNTELLIASISLLVSDKFAETFTNIFKK